MTGDIVDGLKRLIVKCPNAPEQVRIPTRQRVTPALMAKKFHAPLKDPVPPFALEMITIKMREKDVCDVVEAGPHTRQPPSHRPRSDPCVNKDGRTACADDRTIS